MLFNRSRPDGKATEFVATNSGNYLFRKLESWCQNNPRIIMHRISFVPNLFTGGKLAAWDEANSNRRKAGQVALEAPIVWQIEFEFVKAEEEQKDNFFNKSQHYCGIMKPSLEINPDASSTTEIYIIDMNSKNFRGVYEFKSGAEAFTALTGITIE